MRAIHAFLLCGFFLYSVFILVIVIVVVERVVTNWKLLRHQQKTTPLIQRSRDTKNMETRSYLVLSRSLSCCLTLSFSRSVNLSPFPSPSPFPLLSLSSFPILLFPFLPLPCPPLLPGQNECVVESWDQISFLCPETKGCGAYGDWKGLERLKIGGIPKKQS